ncbi:MAG: nickel pincer cofactor biosynthesis protein LarC [Planctomycetota bacterium]|nr:nickel pincer cofactor biosynthesis protein LarC [Planctomycetota bacterium]
MKLLHFDCFSGAAGDMIVGAMLDAGLDFETLKENLASLKLPGCDISAEKVRRGALTGTKFAVTAPEADQPHRNLDDILLIIRSASLPGRSAENAEAVFRRLADAEAKVHGTDPSLIHFHEIGAIDSIIDIVAAAVGIELLGIEEVYCSAIPTGGGVIESLHGTLPVPAPATVELLKGAKTIAPTGQDQTGELTTPTAAAVLTTLARSFGPIPAMELQSVGYGAGTREETSPGAPPNLLRVFIGNSTDDGAVDCMVKLSANLDDCTGELIGATIDKLLRAGCVDAWAAPIYMKKSRPAWTLSALCSPGDVNRAEEIIFAETTTFGIRRRTCTRSKLARRHVTVETPYGPIRVKIGSRDGNVITASPEFTDCSSAAEAHGVPVAEAIAAAAEAYRKQGPGRRD